MLVSGSISACKSTSFSEGFADKCAIITSYRPSVASIKGEETGEGQTEHLHQYEIYNKMLNGKDVETFEKEVKKKFIEGQDRWGADRRR
jgi:type I restriction enzyme R subunit